MKFVKSIEIDKKTLSIEICDNGTMLYKDVYFLIEDYRKHVKIVEIWEQPECPMKFKAKEITTYDIEKILSLLV